MAAATFSPDELSNFKLQYSAAQAGAKQQKQPTATKTGKSPGGVKGLLQGLLPLAGGALGAIGGTFVGGPVGTAAGGAAGSAVGEALKEKLQGGPLNVKNIGEQAAFGALPGVGSGIKTLRAGGAAADLIKGAGGAEGAVTQAVTDKPSLGTKIYNKGVITESRAGGFGQGEKVTGGNLQGFRDSEQNVQNLKNEGIPAANASTRQIAVGDRLAQHAKTIDSAVEGKNPAYTDDQKIDALDRIQKGIVGDKDGSGIPGYIIGNNANSKFADSLINQYASVKDAKGLLSFKRGLDQQAINYGRNSAAPDPIKEQVAKVIRKEVNKDFGKMVPEAKVASTAYSKLHDANEFLKQAARDSSNAATQNGGGAVGRVLTSDTAQTVKTKAGRGMQTLGKALGGKPGAPTTLGAPTTPALATGRTAQVLKALTSPVQVGKAGFKQGVGRSAGALLGIGGETQAPTDQQQAPVSPDVTGESLGGAPITQGTDTTGTDQGADSPYSLQNYLSDVSRDPKNENTYTSIFKELNPDYGSKSSTGGANVSKVTAQQYGLAQSGAQQVQALIKQLQDNPDVLSKSAIPGKGLPIVGGYIANAAGTGTYDSAAYQLADKYIRLTTGAQANDEEIKNTMTKLVPRAGDSPDTVKAKLGDLNQYFQNILQLAGTGGTSDTTTSDLAAEQ